MINHTQKPIRLLKTVAMNTKLHVAMMTNIVNQFKPIGGENAVYEFTEKMLEEVEYCKGIVKRRGLTNH